MTRTQRDILRKRRVLEHAERIGNVPPAEFDALYYERLDGPTMEVGLT